VSLSRAQGAKAAPRRKPRRKTPCPLGRARKRAQKHTPLPPEAGPTVFAAGRLEGLTLKLLKARAREAGASGAAIEDLDDAADPKVRAHAQTGGRANRLGRLRKPAAAREGERKKRRRI
jgi:hypothetical protein